MKNILFWFFYKGCVGIKVYMYYFCVGVFIFFVFLSFMFLLWVVGCFVLFVLFFGWMMVCMWVGVVFGLCDLLVVIRYFLLMVLY